MVSLCLLVPSCNQVTENKAKKNVLFISVDDLNDWVGVLNGHPQATTPNIDKLASQGVLFTNAHAAAPACNPSRVAIMTGLYPTSTGIYLNNHPWRPVIPDVVTIPEYFRDNGYSALGAGKIYHLPYPDSQAWDDYYPSKTKTKPDDPLPDILPANGIPKKGWFDWGPLDNKDEDMGDFKVADWVIDQLNKDQEKPFFLAAGMWRPHLPWFVPKEYFDNYPLGSIKLPPYLENDLEDVPNEGIKMAKRSNDHEKVIEYNQWKSAIQGYLASIEFADAQVGRILEALNNSEYRDNTTIVLWSDHGWQLGEKEAWRKFSLWERSTRVTFIIVDPDIKKAGISSRPVNLIDVFPTLIDLTDSPKKEDLDGLSLLPLIKQYEGDWSRPSITTHGRGNHSIRDDRWRYIKYSDGSEELYDHINDDNEWTNLANDTEYIEVKNRLAKWLPTNEAASAPLDEN
ncbi:MAG: sulfatase [Flavobacteriaceae bacterium]|nr:sulfatase [Flavobacteriaceae bacterium]